MGSPLGAIGYFWIKCAALQHLGSSRLCQITEILGQHRDFCYLSSRAGANAAVEMCMARRLASIGVVVG